MVSYRKPGTCSCTFSRNVSGNRVDALQFVAAPSLQVVPAEHVSEHFQGGICQVLKGSTTPRVRIELLVDFRLAQKEMFLVSVLLSPLLADNHSSTLC
jgi:hypothetical protein